MAEVAIPQNDAAATPDINEKTPVIELEHEHTANGLRPQGLDRDESRQSSESFVSTSSHPQPVDTPNTEVVTSQPEEWHPPTDGPQKTPIPTPSKSSQPRPPAKLTAEQEKKYATILETVQKWETLPASTAKNAAQKPLEDFERMWLTRECLLRYLRATKWNTAQALKRLQTTLSWRREYGADTFSADYISPENETGKQLQLGYDNDARPCLHLNPAKQNTQMSDRQIHHLCYMVDRSIDMMPPGVENLALLINFKGAQSGKIPSVAQGRAVLNILQNHNPERLGKALISELPWYVSTFFKLISPFIDPVTKEKMKFSPNLRDYVPPEQLWYERGGDLKFEYDHSVYWPAFTTECTRRREAARQRWEKAGKRIGEYEEYLRGGNHVSLQQEETSANGAETVDLTEKKDTDATTVGMEKLSVQ